MVLLSDYIWLKKKCFPASCTTKKDYFRKVCGPGNWTVSTPSIYHAPSKTFLFERKEKNRKDEKKKCVCVCLSVWRGGGGIRMYLVVKVILQQFLLILVLTATVQTDYSFSYWVGKSLCPCCFCFSVICWEEGGEAVRKRVRGWGGGGGGGREREREMAISITHRLMEDHTVVWDHVCNSHRFCKLHDPSPDEFDLLLLLLAVCKERSHSAVCVEASKPEMIIGNTLQVAVAWWYNTPSCEWIVMVPVLLSGVLQGPCAGEAEERRINHTGEWNSGKILMWIPIAFWRSLFLNRNYKLSPV